MASKKMPAVKPAKRKSAVTKVPAQQHEQLAAIARQTQRTTIALYTEALDFWLACRAPIILQRWEEDQRALASH